AILALAVAGARLLVGLAKPGASLPGRSRFGQSPGGARGPCDGVAGEDPRGGERTVFGYCRKAGPRAHARRGRGPVEKPAGGPVGPPGLVVFPAHSRRTIRVRSSRRLYRGSEERCEQSLRTGDVGTLDPLEQWAG